MNPLPSELSPQEWRQWREKIAGANRNNIFCHCRDCDKEWVDSGETSICEDCGGDRIERIACWQFPDG
jgi:hypothetical protein